MYIRECVREDRGYSGGRGEMIQRRRGDIRDRGEERDKKAERGERQYSGGREKAIEQREGRDNRAGGRKRQ